MTSKIYLTLPLLVLLTGCASNNHLYAWGNYEESLFANYHEPEVKEEILNEYIAFIDENQSAKKKVAPGLFAEAGTFLYERGDTTGAIRFYELEKQAWPESQQLMQTLINNLQERTQ